MNRILKVVKRNGNISEFDINRIINAIEKAMSETVGGIDGKLSRQIANEILMDVQNREKAFFGLQYHEEGNVTVEEIQDMVEVKLMKDRPDVAKKYILYREERSKARGKKSDYKMITDDFVKNYKHKQTAMTNLGAVVYYRTYSRYLEDEKRRENWWETVRRAVEFNTSIIPTPIEEAQKLYDNIFNLKQFLSGRTMWIGNTPVSRLYSLSNYNCCARIIDSFNAFGELFYLLLVGAGVGVRVLPRDVTKMPMIRTDIKLINKAYTPVKKKDRSEYTSLVFEDDMVEIIVGDSKEAWRQSLDRYFEILTQKQYRKVKTIIMNYDNIRPLGERLKTFGGTASGYTALQEIFVKIDRILSKDKDKNQKQLSTVDCLDICNIIGSGVVVGGVRRTSEIGLGSPDDKEFIEAKSNLYTQENGVWSINEEIAHRQMSNNSIFYESKPTREQLHWQMEQMRYSGEPAFINAEAARKRRSDFEGVNPCFSGNMRLLTSDGYKTFEELSRMENVEIVNKDGDISIGKVWSNGTKKTIVLEFSDGGEVICTPDHKFMMQDGSTIEAKDTVGKRIKSQLNTNGTLIVKIRDGEEIEVFDFIEPLTHWGVVEGLIAHNCGEILLRSQQCCNLTTVNVMGFVENGTLNRKELLEAQRLSARAGYRMTFLNLELHEWDIKQKEDRLTGCSLTGWQDMVNATKMSKKEEAELLRQLREIAHNAIDEYAKELGTNRSLLITTEKPEGSLSQLPTVSSGVHHSHSPYFIRRVRINAQDAVLKTCEELGYPIYPEVGQDPLNPKTKVVEFVIEAPEGRTKYDVSAIEQLENYKMFMENYIDHNCSITVHVRNHEWEEVEQWIWDNWDDVVAISFLALDDSFYNLMPYEAISKEEYEKRKANEKKFTPSLISKYENQNVELDDVDIECSTGACPIR